MPCYTNKHTRTRPSTNTTRTIQCGIIDLWRLQRCIFNATRFVRLFARAQLGNYLSHACAISIMHARNTSTQTQSHYIAHVAIVVVVVTFEHSPYYDYADYCNAFVVRANCWFRLVRATWSAGSEQHDKIHRAVYIYIIARSRLCTRWCCCCCCCARNGIKRAFDT